MVLCGTNFQKFLYGTNGGRKLADPDSPGKEAKMKYTDRLNRTFK